jgi:hypothetical protein
MKGFSRNLQILGVVQYPSVFTKPEMRYAMSVLSRHRTKWGKRHFLILLKSLEYGFHTRSREIIYLGFLAKEELNVLIAYAIGGGEGGWEGREKGLGLG